MRIRPQILPVALLAGALLLSGCVRSQYGEQITPVNYYPQCYEPIGDLRADENQVAQSTAAGAVGGALLGAAIGGLASGDWRGALAGAAVGGASGAVAGNVYGRQVQAERDAEYMAYYAQMLDEDTASMNRATAAAKVATQCYNDEFKRAVEDYKAQRISRDELQVRYEEIRAGLQEVSFVLTQRYDEMSKKDAEYQAALDHEFTQAPKKTPKKASAAQQESVTYKAAQRNEAKDENLRQQAETNRVLSENEALLASIESNANI